MSRGAPLFPRRLRNAVQDLILHLGRGRAWDDGGGSGSPLAGFDEPQNPHLAVGVIGIAAAVASGHGEADAGHLIFCAHEAGGFEISGEQLSLGIDIGIDMMGDGLAPSPPARKMRSVGVLASTASGFSPPITAMPCLMLSEPPRGWLI